MKNRVCLVAFVVVSLLFGFAYPALAARPRGEKFDAAKLVDGYLVAVRKGDCLTVYRLDDNARSSLDIEMIRAPNFLKEKRANAHREEWVKKCRSKDPSGNLPDVPRSAKWKLVAVERMGAWPIWNVFVRIQYNKIEEAPCGFNENYRQRVRSRIRKFTVNARDGTARVQPDDFDYSLYAEDKYWPEGGDSCVEHYEDSDVGGEIAEE